jgi:hypothetical protein
MNEPRCLALDSRSSRASFSNLFETKTDRNEVAGFGDGWASPLTDERGPRMEAQRTMRTLDRRTDERLLPGGRRLLPPTLTGRGLRRPSGRRQHRGSVRGSQGAERNPPWVNGDPGIRRTRRPWRCQGTAEGLRAKINRLIHGCDTVKNPTGVSCGKTARIDWMRAPVGILINVPFLPPSFRHEVDHTRLFPRYPAGPAGTR